MEKIFASADRGRPFLLWTPYLSPLRQIKQMVAESACCAGPSFGTVLYCCWKLDSTCTFYEYYYSLQFSSRILKVDRYYKNLNK